MSKKIELFKTEPEPRVAVAEAVAAAAPPGAAAAAAALPVAYQNSADCRCTLGKQESFYGCPIVVADRQMVRNSPSPAVRRVITSQLQAVAQLTTDGVCGGRLPCQVEERADELMPKGPDEHVAFLVIGDP